MLYTTADVMVTENVCTLDPEMMWETALSGIAPLFPPTRTAETPDAETPDMEVEPFLPQTGKTPDMAAKGNAPDAAPLLPQTEKAPAREPDLPRTAETPAPSPRTEAAVHTPERPDSGKETPLPTPARTALPASLLANRPRTGRRTFIIKDVRFFLNSLERFLDLIRESGLDVKSSRMDTEEAILLTIRIPRGRGARFRKG